MNKLIPLRLAPAFKDYLWGGRRLAEEFGKKTDLEKVAESWELSCHKDGPSRIADGEYSGMTLSGYIGLCGKEILGSNAQKFDYFPLLIKFIDAKDNLSIQVHPNDEYALRVEGEYGKTEMWYILDAAEGAYLYYGFNRDVTHEELAERIKNNTVLEVLNKVSVKKGDVFFIGAGTVHAICSGIVICEIQQNSNTTYRVYDYDRRDKDGNARPLHIEKALEVANLKKAPEIPAPAAGGVLASCEYFTAEKLTVCGSADYQAGEESFLCLSVVSGSGKMTAAGCDFALAKGDSFFVPAGKQTLRFEGSCEIIISRV